MMRKLLVLMLVLALASMASATVSLSPSPSITITTGDVLAISVISDSTAQAGYEGAVFKSSGPGALSNGAKTAAAGTPLGSISGLMTYPKGTGYIIIAGSTNNDLSSGTQFTMDFSSAATGTAVINLYQPGALSTPVDTLTVTIVPEPMTIVLLGLGGLLLRRKK